MTNEMIDFWDAIYEVSGIPFYDSEELALGSLNKSEYMLEPRVSICCCQMMVNTTNEHPMLFGKYSPFSCMLSQGAKLGESATSQTN
ncbi:hypothetical protein HanIR_Chr07g0336891 [Helianthus annuus]|nr:hypothetical protein HanIR_Chr07g0336891 [Helianthus annuus]